MGPLNHPNTNELEYVVDDAAGLAEFDSESGAAPGLWRSPRGPAVLWEVGRRTVIEPYKPAELVSWPAASSVPSPWSAALKTASTAVLVMVTTGAPVDTERSERGKPVRMVETVQPRSTAAPVTAVSATAVPAEPRRQIKPAVTSSKPASQAPSEPRSDPPAARPSEVQLASLRQAFASLNGPFMTFEHCEVRLASPDRAIARCQGRSDAEPGSGAPAQRRVEWTLDFDRAAERWLIVDAAAR